MVKIEITKVKDGVYAVRVGFISFQLDNDEIYTLMHKLGKAVGMVAVDFDELKGMTERIDHILHDDLTVSKHSIPLRTTTNDNNDTKKYTGSTVSTADLLKLNQDLKKDS